MLASLHWNCNEEDKQVYTNYVIRLMADAWQSSLHVIVIATGKTIP